MRENYIYIAFPVILALFLSFAFIFEEETKEISNTKKVVSLSTFTLYDIAQHIAEDTLELVRIIPSGVDIHAYEPTPSIMAKVEKSNLLIYNGAQLEPWLGSFNFKHKAIEIADYISLKHVNDEEDEHDGHEHHGDACSHSQFDPHFWFDVENMKDVAEIITYEFIRLEPNNKALYIDNKKKYIKMLDKLDSVYKQKLETCALDTIITNHNAFFYLSDKYGFKVSSLKGLSPDSEPSPKDVIRIIDAIEKLQAPIIFFEDFSSNKSMRELATRANIKIDSLHTLGNTTKKDAEQNLTYEDIMLQNLNKIQGALVCQ